MTTPDLDLLADYAARLLPPDEEAAVAARIAAEPGWRAAHDALVAALPAVHLALSGVDDPMPADVADRLDAALRAEAARPPAGATATTDARRPESGRSEAGRPDSGRPAGTRPDGGRSDRSRPGGTRSTGTRPADRRDRRRRAPRAVLALAAVFIAVACVGFAIRIFPTVSASTTSSAGKAAAPAPAMDSAEVRDTASGHNYTRADLNNQAAFAAGGNTFNPEAPGATRTPAATPGATGGTPRSSALGADAAGQLLRLDAKPALDACLLAVENAHGGQAETVDYAYFEGTPALIVRLTEPAGNTVVVAVGARCGLGGADELYATDR